MAALLATAWLAGAVILLLHAPAVGDTLTVLFQHARRGDAASLLPLAPVMIALGSLIYALVALALEEETA